MRKARRDSRPGPALPACGFTSSYWVPPAIPTRALLVAAAAALVLAACLAPLGVASFVLATWVELAALCTLVGCVRTMMNERETS